MNGNKHETIILVIVICCMFMKGGSFFFTITYERKVTMKLFKQVLERNKKKLNEDLIIQLQRKNYLEIIISIHGDQKLRNLMIQTLKNDL